jgi:hypothetical protein
MEVIVLDGNQRSALAVTRSLGIKGIRVLVGTETKSPLASSSAYCSGSFVYPLPYMSTEGFLGRCGVRIKALAMQIWPKLVVLLPVRLISLH